MSDRFFTPTSYFDSVEYRGKPRMGDDVGIGGGKTLDPNRYATKKTIAQGMLDIALLTANASQLKYVLQIGEKHEFYSLMLGLIVTSLVLQGLTAVLLSVLTRLNIKHYSSQGPADIINHIVLGLNLLILAIDTIKMGLNNGYQPVVVGVMFLIIGGMDINDPSQHKAADILNNIIVIFLFIISVVNVVLSAFGIEQMNLHPPGTKIPNKEN